MRGGALPVFRGKPYQGGYGVPYYQFGYGLPVFYGQQYGSGLGDVLCRVYRTVVPFLAPILAKAGKSFLSNAHAGLESGKSFKEAAKAAFGPTILDTAEETGGQIGSRLDAMLQKGRGGRKRTKARRVYKGVKRARKTVKRRSRKWNKKSARQLKFKYNF